MAGNIDMSGKPSKHSLKVKGIEVEKEDLACRIGDLYYDSLSDFLNLLADKIQLDGEADRNRGRVKLSNELFECTKYLKEAANHIENAWDICEPFVKEWEERNNTTRS